MMSAMSSSWMNGCCPRNSDDYPKSDYPKNDHQKNVHRHRRDPNHLCYWLPKHRKPQGKQQEKHLNIYTSIPINLIISVLMA